MRTRSKPEALQRFLEKGKLWSRFESKGASRKDANPCAERARAATSSPDFVPLKKKCFAEPSIPDFHAICAHYKLGRCRVFIKTG